MRLFVAYELDTAIRARLADVTKRAGDDIDGVKWVTRENIHITLKFLGEADETMINRIVDALDTALAGRSGLALTIRGLGAFPPRGTPQVLWAGVTRGRDALISLSGAVEQALEPAGFEREKRSFSPHATIGRTRKKSHPRGLRELIDGEETTDFGSQEETTITLMRSELTPTGPIYTPVHTWNLERN